MILNSSGVVIQMKNTSMLPDGSVQPPNHSSVALMVFWCSSYAFILLAFPLTPPALVGAMSRCFFLSVFFSFAETVMP